MDIPELDKWNKERNPIEYLAKKVKAVREALIHDDWALNKFIIDSHQD